MASSEGPPGGLSVPAAPEESCAGRLASRGSAYSRWRIVRGPQDRCEWRPLSARGSFLSDTIGLLVAGHVAGARDPLEMDGDLELGDGTAESASALPRRIAARCCTASCLARPPPVDEEFYSAAPDLRAIVQQLPRRCRNAQPIWGRAHNTQATRQSHARI